MRRRTAILIWAASFGATVLATSMLLSPRASGPSLETGSDGASLADATAALGAATRRSSGPLTRDVRDARGSAPTAPRPSAEEPLDPAAILARYPEADLANFSDAIASYKARDLTSGDRAAKAVGTPLLKTALEWVALRHAPREAGFERLHDFTAIHEDWPSLAWLRKRSEEALLGENKSSAVVKSYFAHTQPQTPAGKLALAGVLLEDGEVAEAARLVRSVWRDDDINAWLEARIRSKFEALLERADHKYRADRLLYEAGRAGAALRAAKLAGPDVLALAKARAAVIAEARDERAMAAVPAPLRSDPGFLFAKVQILRRADKLREAADILLVAPRDQSAVIDGDAWWIERRLVARKLLDLGDARTAYLICAQHAAEAVPTVIDAEFHAGWIALRFLRDPQRASAHFDKAAAVATTPISIARATYWQGRAMEAASGEGATGSARHFYEAAAAHPSTYYGQLAGARLGLASLPVRSIADQARGDERAESIRVVELLYAMGEKDVAESLVMDNARHLVEERQVAALGAIVASRQDARLSLAVGKIASQRGFPLDTLAFPAYGIPNFEPLHNSAPASIVYSVARQESAFNTKAVSPAGAKGLMQMMTATARSTAARASIAFDATKLISDPSFNARLGAAHLGDLLDAHRGSCILAFAAYNAGPGRVKEWVEAYGDPRKPDVDPVDWVERIPFTETRNYVQRVSENVQVYRVRFGEPARSLFDRMPRLEAKL